MTVGELKKVLEKFDDNAVIALEYCDTDYGEERCGIYCVYVDNDLGWSNDDIMVLSEFNSTQLESIRGKNVMWEEDK